MKLLLVCLSFACCVCYGQQQPFTVFEKAPTNLQYGISAKGTVEFLRGIPNLRLGLNAGLGLPVLHFLYPAFNAEINLYHGGLGSRFQPIGNDRARKSGGLDLIVSGMLTAGWDRVDRLSTAALQSRNAPLYYFSDFVPPALQNPYGGSVSIGVNFFHPYLCNGDKVRQRAGFVDFHFQKFQIAYCNDGGPGMDIIGDGEDRYYTGSGFAAYNDPLYKDFNTYVVSFHKYTGWTKRSFDDADMLLFGFTDYKKVEQSQYNSAFWSFSAGNARYGSVFFRFNNPKNFRETQNLIHYSHGNPFHQNLVPAYHSFGVSGTALSTYIPRL